MLFLRRELFVLGTYLSLLNRDRKKYFKVATISYLLGALGICNGAKSSYFFCRIIDDCADGDQDSKDFGYSDFEHLLNDLTRVLNQKQRPKTNLEILAEQCAKINHGNNTPYLLDFLEAMRTECRRRSQKKLLTQQQLDAIHQNSFAPVLKIAFNSLQTKFNNELINDLTKIQSKVYSIQDLEKDFELGIYNFPAHLAKNDSSISLNDLLSSNEFEAWKTTELQTAKKLGVALLHSSHPQKTKKVIHTLVNPILEDIDALSQ